MGRPRGQAKPPRTIARGFERSRLEERLVAAAYELAVPIVRRSLSPEAAADQGEETDRVDGHEARSVMGGKTA
jgi:hypothetical protein